MKEETKKQCSEQKSKEEDLDGEGRSFEAYMVGASASEGVAARAASFSEAMGLKLVKCDANAQILSLILLMLPVIMVCLGKPQIQRASLG